MRRALAFCAVAAALAALGSGCGKPPPPPSAAVSVPTPGPTPTPVSNTVVFVRSGGLWVEHPLGNPPRLLASPGVDEDYWFPAIAPDGSGLVAWLSRGDGTQDIVHVSASGAVDVLTDTGERAQAAMKDLSLANGPSWSPDGKRVAYSFNGNLWIMDADGLDPQTLISDGASWSPAWSPDGRRLAYVNGDETHKDLWVTDVDSRDTYQLTDFKDYTVGGPHWSPDGQRILVSRTRGDESDIVAIPSQGDTPTTTADVLTHDHLSISGVFNPSGSGILFSSAKADSMTWNLYTQDGNGASLTEVTHAGGLSPDWSTHLFAGAAASTPVAAAVSVRPTPYPASAAQASSAPAPNQNPVAGSVSAPQAQAAVPADNAATVHALPSSPVSVNTPAMKTATLRLRLRVGYDAQDHLDAASMAALQVLARRVRQYAGSTVDVVGPLDGSDLAGMYFSEESRSQSRAQAIGVELSRLAGTPAARMKASPYSPPAAGGEPNSILIYVELR